jgi:hypothetical protein
MLRPVLQPTGDEGRCRAGGRLRRYRCGFECRRDAAGRGRHATARAWRACAFADVAGPQRDGCRDRECGARRFAFRCPLFYAARNFFDADPRSSGHSAASRRPRRAHGYQSRGSRTARGSIGGVTRKRAGARLSGATSLRAGGIREPAQRNPTQRAARPSRTPATGRDAGADPHHCATAARALQQAPQAPAPRSPRSQADTATKRGLGRRTVPHLLETPPPRPAEDRCALRRQRIGSASSSCC